MMKYFSYIIFLALLNIVPTCNCNSSKCDNTYRFEIPVQFTPVTDSIRIGDTITIKMSFSETMEDLYTGDTYPLKDFPIITEIGLIKIDTTIAVEGYKDFETQVKKGSLDEIELVDSKIWHMKYGYVNSQYDFEIGIIPKKIGLYVLGFHSFSFSGTEFIINPDCGNEKLEFIYNTNNNGNNGFEMTQSSPDKDVQSYTLQEFNEGGGRAFQVID